MSASSGRKNRLLAFVVLSVATVATAGRSPGQSSGSKEPMQATGNLPQTPWGDPDIEGVWTYATMTPLERPRELAGKAVLTEAEAAEYERQVLERQATTNNTAGPDWWDPGTRRLTGRRTSLIVDPPNGRMPPLTAEAQQRSAARAQARRERGVPEGPEDLALNERCLIWSTAGPPMLPGVYNNNVQLVQTRHHVLIFNEMIHDARIVPIDGRPHGTARQWMGDSRGHWEGATLVVETLNFSDKTAFRGSDERLRLVERFTRVDAATIAYQFLVDDASIWTQPWTAAFPLHRSTGLIYEYACHEGNARSVEGILRGARSAPQ
jgi:hypothetical protein